MGALISLLSSAFGGSLIGSIGSFCQKWIEGKNQATQMQLKFQHESDMADKEYQQMKLQLESAKAVAEVKADEAAQQASYTALSDSMNADAATYSKGTTNPWLIGVDVIRGIMRPTITIGLTVYIAAVVIYNFIQYGGSFIPADVSKATLAILADLGTYAGVAITWWFGARPHNPTGKRPEDK